MAGNGAWNTALAGLLGLCLAGCGASGDPLAAFNKGDYAAAMKLWQPKAEAGDKIAQNYMGVLYQLGLGVDRDYVKAVQWYVKAAENGNADAQRILGTMYYDGNGVSQNTNCAYAWYYVASQNGHALAEEARKSIANELTPNKTRIMENRIRAYLKGKPGELKVAGEGSSEYERVEKDLAPEDMQCDGSIPGQPSPAAPAATSQVQNAQG
ncbi:MAG TPA: tetratricopeptide repeat protein [Gammaproteobacteria bacterium]|nr:tetratricopeptide repeat protein [Gammaproteobacteria bacterium]